MGVFRQIPSRNDKYYQCRYVPENPQKYVGDVTFIICRSRWEYNMARFLDLNEKVLQWSSESITIPYEIQENGQWTTKRYFPDFYAKIKTSDGRIIEEVIEVKPYAETLPPKEPKRKTLKSYENYEYRLRMYLKNLAKWKTAKEYCEKRGLKFFLLTEKFFENTKIKLF